MGVERESKYSATPALLAALANDDTIRDMETERRTLRMETAYLDTADGDFAQKKWTLRVRKENGAPVVTMKTAATDGARGEWEHPGEAPDAEKLTALGAPKELETLLKKPLIPVCGAKFTRIAVTLRIGESLAELALDEGILFRGERQAPLCEVELEQIAGDAAEIGAFTETLREKYGLQEEKMSKFQRAVRL